VLLRMFEKTGEKKYQLAADKLRAQLKDHPKTQNGVFWHKKIYPHQLWLDGVYMGMPYLAYYSQLFENGASLDQVVHEFEVTREMLRDPATGLYFHAWDESKSMNWADPATGRSKFFWSRGIGWLSMALLDVLDHIPETSTELRQPLLSMIPELADALLRFQDPASGVWWQITDKAGERGNYLESSGSSMFVYFLAKAQNKGYLSGPQYRDATIKGYQGLLNEFVLVHPDQSISLTKMVQVAGLGAGRDGSYHYYMSEPIYRNDSKGSAAFIMAGVQVSKLLKN
jgi:unsaturated rhamnogalacturonyl hydrolase